MDWEQEFDCRDIGCSFHWSSPKTKQVWFVNIWLCFRGLVFFPCEIYERKKWNRMRRYINERNISWHSQKLLVLVYSSERLTILQSWTVAYICVYLKEKQPKSCKLVVLTASNWSRPFMKRWINNRSSVKTSVCFLLSKFFILFFFFFAIITQPWRRLTHSNGSQSGREEDREESEWRRKRIWQPLLKIFHVTEISSFQHCPPLSFSPSQPASQTTVFLLTSSVHPYAHPLHLFPVSFLSLSSFN